MNTSRFKWFGYDKAGNTFECPPTFKKIHIWDGRPYDNLGIEPLVKNTNTGEIQFKPEIIFLIVSDAALEINTAWRKWYNAMRLIDITMDQVRALRARVLWGHFQQVTNSGVYFKIGKTVDAIKADHNYSNTISNKGLTAAEVEACKFFPTTLWKMKESEFNSLVNHGWEVANAALVCQCPVIFKNQKA